VYERGDAWLARLPGIGLKPALIVSRRVVSLSLRPVVARITSVDRERSIPTAVALQTGDLGELPQSSWVICHDLFTLPDRSALVQHLGTIPPQRLVEVDAALRYTLSLQ
jgi:mRNA-degrading endonuclease toxin of MazEF toxin-antitoxin module